MKTLFPQSIIFLLFSNIVIITMILNYSTVLSVVMIFYHILIIAIVGKCSTQGEPSDSLQCTGPHEHFTLCRQCPKTCSTNNKTIIPCGAICMEGCICDKGYLQNHAGVCVLVKDCFKCKGANEFFDCGSACDTECDKLGQKCPIINVKCNEKCYCKKGFARSCNNTCIPIKQCPDRCCNKPHEHYSECGTCEKTCRNFNVSTSCAAVCMVGCFCDKGYVRNHEGGCVRIKDCFKCDGANEFFDCGSACDRECATLGVPCPIVNIKCNDKCYCKPGFARDNRNICVPIKECPASPPKSCGINQVLDCLCLPRTTCKDPCKLPMYCPLGKNGKCIKECICKPGFVRNKNGQCTHASQCTPLDEDDCCDNEVFQTCGTFCPESCKDKGQSVPCTKQCVQSCFCKKGLIRDNKGHCVRRKDCAP